MIKLRQNKLRLSALTLFSLLSMTVLFMASCDEDNSVEGDPRLVIEGPTTALPESSATYDLQVDIGGTTTWTVEGPASLTSSTESVAELTFNSVGMVTITATNGSLEGIYYVNVNAVDAAVAASMKYGKANNGGTDTLFLSFPAPLASAPSLAMNGLNPADTSAFFRTEDNKSMAPFVSPGSSLSAAMAYKGSTMEYYALYTGGSGAGQAEAIVTSATVADNFGGSSIENVYLLIEEVDNVAPIGEIAFSSPVAKDSATVTISAMFNEAVRPVTVNPGEMNYIFIDISYGDGSGLVVQDTLWATDDPSVWSLDYTVNGESTTDPNTTLDVSVSRVADLAGNIPTVLEDASMLVDNVAPVATGMVQDVDPGTQVVEITTSGQWLVREGGEPAPVFVAEFAAGGTGAATLVLDPGTYDVYFIEVDAAGNVSNIESQLDFVVAAP
ncbi:hypothetical protein [Reichenbachiella agariperforans]|uniref:hypothetical protein n=1 Tax=Reichenbachiella agariperforans TaxID=156994 RepID=UPI001C09D2BB|nr:hypothetical protein [Reichenbachiella agariperforans]MBU2915311.1 hypothetical protein [Reichenbachiella agariperforans]